MDKGSNSEDLKARWVPEIGKRAGATKNSMLLIWTHLEKESTDFLSNSVVSLSNLEPGRKPYPVADSELAVRL